MTKGRGKGNVIRKRKAHAKVRSERILKEIKDDMGLCEDKKCYVISKHRNLEASALDGTIMYTIPNDYVVLHEKKVAIRDKSTKEIVLVVSFTTFKDLQSTNEYKDFEKLTTSLAKLREGNSSYIKYNKSMVNGKMFEVGWMDRGYTKDQCGVGSSIQNSEDAIEECKEQVHLVKWISNFYDSKFMKLSRFLYTKTLHKALEVGVPLLSQAEYPNLEQTFEGFSSNLTYTVDDFYNKFHSDEDHSAYVYGIWAPTVESNGKLAKLSDGFQCNGGHFIVPRYKLYVDFGRCDGVVEIIWRANFDLHATSPSTTAKGFTRVGTSAQIQRTLVQRVQSSKKDQQVGEDVNPRVLGIKETKTT